MHTAHDPATVTRRHIAPASDVTPMWLKQYTNTLGRSQMNSACKLVAQVRGQTGVEDSWRCHSDTTGRYTVHVMGATLPVVAEEPKVVEAGV